MRNTIPKPKEILKFINWSGWHADLYPGYSKSSIRLDNYFESKDDAYEQVQHVYDIFAALKSRKVIPVYRTMWLQGNVEGLDREFLGEHWSWERDAAVYFGQSCGYDYLLSGTVKPSKVDWASSVAQYMEYSFGHDEQAEFELVIPSGQVDNLIVEKI